ncbi:MAG TPA: hypothetical protein DHW02_13870 [Ktedonobacter sp.]|nr:hypothetical protein [Ktedonobacter sp.]
MIESSRSQALLGKTLGTCRIERILGQGGMGVVFLAQQQRPMRYVAIKVLLPDVSMNAQVQQHYLARFRREADVIATLEHMNIVPIYGYDEQDGMAYLVMPYLQGGSLYDILAQRGSLSLEETIKYMHQVAQALDYAHAHGVIHRDLKPANFLFHSDGRLLLSDFGIAHIVQDSMSTQEAPLTSVGMLPGTPHFMAPEMLRGEQFDYRIDLYALGVILYQLLSGQLPFDGATPFVIMNKHLQEQPPSLHQLRPFLPLEVDTVIQRALAKNPTDRFSSAIAMIEALSTASSSSVQEINFDAPTILPFQTMPAVAAPAASTPPRDATTVKSSISQRSQSRIRQGKKPLLAEERKLVTILSVGVDSTSLFEETPDPEDVRAFIRQYHTHIQQVISHYEGTIEQLADDTALAIFGLPQILGDEATRACAAALALQQATSNDRESFLLQIGIATGEIVVTNNSSSTKYDVQGEVVKIATRLQQAADVEEILVDERTAQVAQTLYTFGEAHAIKLKGRKQSLRSLPLTGMQQSRQIDRPALVGRKQDLLQLELLKERVLEEQRPHLVSIVAPAGIGKSRLLEEFLSRLDTSEGFQFATATCLPYGQSLPYRPLHTLLTELLDGDIDRQKILDAFTRSGHTYEDATRLTEHILTTLDTEQEESTDRERMFSAWRMLIESLAREAPHIIIFEDLHWASDGLLNLVEHLMHPRTQAPLLVLALSRPELLERRPNWGGGQKNFLMLNLEPLSNVQTRELVRRLMPSLSPEMCQRIAARSGGNPFFAIELVRTMAEQGNNGENVEMDILPDTVHAAILARLDRLSPQERSIVQVASVAGHSFHATMLQAILSDLSPDEITVALDELLARNVIEPAEKGEYGLRHTLIRDVAYGTLSRADRIRFHAAIVNWAEPLATEHPDEYMELFAYHYREASLLARQSAVPLELPFDLNRALRPWRRRDRGSWLDLDFSE